MVKEVVVVRRNPWKNQENFAPVQRNPLVFAKKTNIDYLLLGTDTVQNIYQTINKSLLFVAFLTEIYF